MNDIMLILFNISLFIIFWAMIGYPLSIKLIGKLYKNINNDKNYDNLPEVTVMVVAHNEEKVINKKLENLLNINYDKEKIRFLIASDNSTDRTNEIVEKFIENNTQINLELFKVRERKGKTNAQNEAQKLVKTDFLVMTDANSILHEDSVTELMASFSSPDVAYVSGRLIFENSNASEVSSAEATYWDADSFIREIEGKLHSITAGNGALYACRTKEYIHFDPIQCHDSAMPPLYTLNGKRAIANHDAIAVEKAGEVIEDEFSRKVRMNRILLKYIMPDFRVLNIFKYKWFSYFYFGHRTCRYLLWISHLILLVSNIYLAFSNNMFFGGILFFHILFYFFALLAAITKINNKIFTLCYYYTVTILAQWVGVFNSLTGKSKPFWEKAESTR